MNVMSPPCRRTMPYTMLMPNPLPFSPFVVKKGSKRRRLTSADIPSPVSLTVTTTDPASS